MKYTHLIPEDILEWAKRKRMVKSINDHIDILFKNFGYDIKFNMKFAFTPECCCGKCWQEVVIWIDCKKSVDETLELFDLLIEDVIDLLNPKFNITYVP